MNIFALRCIQRNPTKGIERLQKLLAEHMAELKEMCCIQRNPTKGIESRQFSAHTSTASSFSCIQRNPTKGIESVDGLYEDVAYLASVLHSTKSHKGN